MIFQRLLLDHLQKSVQPGKVLVLYGPRRSGKTTLVKDFCSSYTGRYRFLNADELTTRELLASQNSSTLGTLVHNVDLLIIDEAQRITDIGINLKILVDTHPSVAIIATGSASFDLANKISEPLTGRKKTLLLYPVCYQELEKTLGVFESKQQLERWLIWGTYPELLSLDQPASRKAYLDELTGSYLYKDILELEGVRYPSKIIDLLRAIAFQIGQEVSFTELAGLTAMNRETVERYIDLLEKSFVIYQIRGFSRNLRKEIIKNPRIYFYDNGIRNALIQNFNPLAIRNDIGALWENFLMTERMKILHYRNQSRNRYFWRTYDQKEIDLIEEHDGMIHGYEFKWQGKAKPSTTRLFEATYQGATVQTVTKDTFVPFLA